MNDSLAKILRKFFALGVLSIAALAVSGVYAVKISDVVLKHYWDSNNNKAWIGGDYYELTFKVTPGTGETIYAVDIAWKTNGGTTDATGSNKNCTIKLGGNEVDKCTEGQTCTVTCNIDLSQISQGTEYYLVVGFDMDNNGSGTDIGDVKADKTYYWKKETILQKLVSNPVELKFRISINSDETIYGVGATWTEDKDFTDTTGSTKCNIDDGNEKDGNNHCEKGETCIITCNVDKSETRKYLAIGFDTDDGNSGTNVGGVDADVIAYLKKDTIKQIIYGSAKSIEFNVSLSSGSGKAIHGVNVALINVYDGSEVSEVTCSIDDGKGGNTCNEGENCKITCDIDLSPIGSGIEYYLVAKFDIDGDGNADVEYYWRTSDQELINDESKATKIEEDETDPTTDASATAGGSSYTSGTWTNKDVTVTLSPTDSESGVVETKYTIRDGDYDCDLLSYSDLDQTYSGPIEITANSGETVIKTIYYASKDRVGNVESIKKFVVKIDKKAPSITFDMPEYVNNLGTISAIVTDQGSGVREVKIQISYKDNNRVYYWNGNEWVSDATWLDMTSNGGDEYTYDASGVTLTNGIQYTIRIKAVDNVGNSITVEDITTADTKNPSITGYSINGITKDGALWIGGKYNTIEVNATDNIALIKYLIYLDTDNTCNSNDPTTCGTLVAELDTTKTSVVLELGKETTNAQGGWNSITSGDYYMHIIVEDKAGNVDIKTVQVKVDKDVPSITFDYKDEDGNTYSVGNWINKTIIVRVFVNDNGIGVSKALYKVISTDSCPSDVTQYYTLPEGREVVISDEGKWRVCIYAEDLLGNNKIGKSDVIKIDKTQPTVNAIRVVKADNKVAYCENDTCYVNTENIKLQIDITDTSGVDSIKVYVNGNEKSVTQQDGNYIVDVTDITSGNYTIKVEAVDKAGNKKVYEQNITIVLDKEAPELLRIYYVTPRKVKIEFSETVEVEIPQFKVELLYPNGMRKEEQVGPLFSRNYANSHEIILNYPVTSDKELLIIFWDKAGNTVSKEVRLENAPDKYIVLPVGEWAYVAFDYEVDTDYGLWKMVVNRNGFYVGTYLGEGWKDGKDKFGKMLYGYAVYVEKAVDEGFDTEILPIKVLPMDKVTIKLIQLKEGWNLIGVYDTEYANTTADNTLSILNTSLNTLRTEKGLVFSYIALPATREVAPANDKVPIRFAEWISYWVLIPNLVEREYINYWAPISPKNPNQ